jgi:predicted nucleotidyltransferase
MTNDRFIEPVMRDRIAAELAAIEREHGVRILLAVESGSRAWRFPSRDSDYDVRFLYLQPAERYLTVAPRRDVIERPIDTTLDVSGWDLRKAIQLLLRSNAVLIEWLTSPVRYRAKGTVPGHLLTLARATADLTALAYHYDRQARRSIEEIAEAGGAVRLKTYCYALRSALALLWLRRFREPPPMDMPSLMSGLALPENVSATIADLVARKETATERDTIGRIEPLDRLIDDILAEPVQHIASVDRADVAAKADALFASIVLAEFSARRSPSALDDERPSCS